MSTTCWNLFPKVSSYRKMSWKTTPGISCRWRKSWMWLVCGGRNPPVPSSGAAARKCGLPGAADAGERINPFVALSGLKASRTDFFGVTTWPFNRTKKSPSKRGMHRAHDFLTNPPLAVESTTGEVHLRHHISPTGFTAVRKS